MKREVEDNAMVNVTSTLDEFNRSPKKKASSRRSPYRYPTPGVMYPSMFPGRRSEHMSRQKSRVTYLKTKFKKHNLQEHTRRRIGNELSVLEGLINSTTYGRS